VANVAPSAPEQVRRTEREVQSQVAEGQIQQAMAGRVERLVARMEAVASRIDAEGTSGPRRAILMARFNDLQRQVNELDGIVVPEGQEAQAQKQLDSGASAARATSDRRARVRPETSAAATTGRAARRRAPQTAAAAGRTQATVPAKAPARAPAPRKGNTPAAAAAGAAKVDVIA